MLNAQSSMKTFPLSHPTSSIQFSKVASSAAPSATLNSTDDLSTDCLKSGSPPPAHPGPRLPRPFANPATPPWRSYRESAAPLTPGRVALLQERPTTEAGNHISPRLSHKSLSPSRRFASTPPSESEDSPSQAR